MSNEQFVQRFEEAWRDPMTRFPALFHPEGTLHQSGMSAPLGRADIPAFLQRTAQVITDLRINATHWGMSGEDVLIEWVANAVVAGTPMTWQGASRFTLRDGLIIEEKAYFDTAPLRDAMAGLDPR